MITNLSSRAFAFLLSVSSAWALTPANLRCEYRPNPLGIDNPAPRLSWLLEYGEPGAVQSAYQILAATTPSGPADLWDSGRVASKETHLIEYKGKPLASNQRVFWKVRVWDGQGRPSAFSPAAEFTMGILRAEDWRAGWIGPGNGAPLAGPLPILRREFQISKPVRRALIHISGLGHFELRINGTKAGDHEMDPGWTKYRKSVFYVTHEVTPMLRQGANVTAVLLGNGFFNIPGGRYAKFTGSFGSPRLLAQLHVEYEDGTSLLIPTNGTWRMTSGPITFSCIYGGEDFDARLEPAGWDRPGFDDSKWKPASSTDSPGGELRSQVNPPIRVQRVYQSVRVSEPKPGVLVYDLGRNFAGRPRITVRGPAGTRLRITPGELLGPDGLPTQRSSGAPVWFEYTLRGQGDETWHPRFTYYGFRYLQIEGFTRNQLRSVSGEFLYSAAEPAGQFECSKPLFNQIHELILAALRSNLQSVITDCPHREKLGWLEVPHLMGPSLFYNHDAATLYAKIAADMREAQLANGLVPDIAPEYVAFRGGFRDSPEWGSAAFILPWQIREWYGDSSAIRSEYPLMKRYAEYLWSQSDGGILTHGLGDWYDIGPGQPGASKLTPRGLTATGFLFHNYELLRKSADLLTLPEDASVFAARAAQVGAAFKARFYDPAKGVYGSGSQTSLALPLIFGLVPLDRLAPSLDALVNDVRARGNHPSAGDIGHRFLIQALEKGGRSDVVFDMAAQEEPPSYGAQLKAGATALTEAWDGNPLSSHNHCMLGHLEEWFYSGLAGIQPDPAAPGFRHFVLSPQPVGDLEWVRARYASVRGEIRSEWRRRGSTVEFDFTVPPNTTATVMIPGAKPVEVAAGNHHFTAGIP